MHSVSSRWHTPASSRPVVGSQATDLENFRRKLLDTFTQAGCQLIHLPAITNQIADENAYPIGQSSSLRTDTTKQLAKWVTHFEPAKRPLADYCYAENVVHRTPAHPSLSREFTQIGVECYQQPNETKHFALRGLDLLLPILSSLDTFIIEFSHSEIKRNILNLLPSSVLEQGQSALERKAPHEWQDIQATQEVKEALSALHQLHGQVKSSWDQDYTKQWNLLASKDSKADIVHYQRNLAEQIKHFQQGIASLESKQDFSTTPMVRFDLAMATIDSYYDGVVFNVYHPQAQYPIIKGGEYQVQQSKACGFTCRTDLLVDLGLANST